MVLKVLKNRREIHDYFSLILEKPENFIFYPGQFLDISLPVKDPLGKSRILSIASSPSEDFIMLTYKLGITPFKKSLEKLKEGDIVSSTHPAGTVVIDDSSPLVMMAGGIGITPYRSMIKWLADQKSNLSVFLIYINSDEDFIFKEELDKWSKQLKNLKIFYHVTRKSGRLNQESFQKLYPLPFTLYPVFYIAGPPKMVDDFENMLLNLGIDQTSIRTDRFDGY